MKKSNIYFLAFLWSGAFYASIVYCEPSLVNSEFNQGVAAILTGVNPRVPSIAQKLLPEGYGGPELISMQPALHSKLENVNSWRLADVSFSEVETAPGLCVLKAKIFEINSQRKLYIAPIIRNDDQIVIGFASIAVSSEKEPHAVNGYVWCKEGNDNNLSIADMQQNIHR